MPVASDPAAGRIGRAPRAAAAALSALVLGFAVVTFQVVHGAGLARVDQSVHDTLVSDRTQWWTSVAHRATDAGSVLAIVALTALAVVVTVVRRDRTGLICLLATVLPASLVLVVIKDLVARSRPPVADMLGAAPHSYSFPSGHTTMSTVLYGVGAVLVARRADPLRRWALGVGYLALVAMVGWSRVYLGFHWLTDVVGGWLLGGAIVVTTYLVLDRRPRAGG